MHGSSAEQPPCLARTVPDRGRLLSMAEPVRFLSYVDLPAVYLLPRTYMHPSSHGAPGLSPGGVMHDADRSGTRQVGCDQCIVAKCPNTGPNGSAAAHATYMHGVESALQVHLQVQHQGAVLIPPSTDFRRIYGVCTACTGVTQPFINRVHTASDCASYIPRYLGGNLLL